MSYLKDLSRKLYNHKFIRYLVVGSTTFVIDLSLLALLKVKFNVNLTIATSVAYWVSIAYNFCLNRWWSFTVSEKASLSRHVIKYAILLGFNYIFTIFFVTLGSHYMSFVIAKILAVLIQMPWTYFVYKNYIFTKKEPIDTILDKKVTNSKV